MSKLVFFPSDPIIAYIEKGRTYQFLDEYYNPGGFFDEVICLSPWGDVDDEVISNIRYIKASPYKFKKIIEDLKPDVIRGYGGYCCADWVSFSKVEGIPSVVSVHDTNPELIHASLQYADAIICMSQAVKDAVLKLVPNVTKNIWVMPNRIDTSIYSKRIDDKVFGDLNNWFPGKYHVLHVGRKAKQKNLDTVIRAMRFLPDDLVTVFVGQGDTSAYKKLACEEGVEERCYFVDRIASEELPYLYSWCDCMCTPSRWEGFGYVFIEAAACEAAIVTSNIGPMNEYLTDRKNALLVDDYENPIEISKAILSCLRNDDSIHQMKKSARNVGLMFEKENIDKQEMEIYRQVISLDPIFRNNNSLKHKMYFADLIGSIFAGIKRVLKIFKVDKLYHCIKRCIIKNV